MLATKGGKMNRPRYRYLKLKLSDREWFALKELKSKMHCETWDDFIKKLIENRDTLVRIFSSLPP